MAEYFHYPNNSDPTKTLTFESGGGTDGHLMTDKYSYRFNQITDETVSGIRMARNLGSHFGRWEYTVVVPLSSGSYTDWADMVEFFGSSYANGCVNSFYWTDTDTTVREVRLVSMELEREMLASNVCRVTMVIEAVNS